MFIKFYFVMKKYIFIIRQYLSSDSRFLNLYYHSSIEGAEIHRSQLAEKYPTNTFDIVLQTLLD